MKALVLGGTGFAGMNIVRALVASGHDVAASRRTRANTLFARKLGARLVQAELDDSDSLVEAMRGHEVVFHCAGYYPRFSLDVETHIEQARRTTVNVLDAARRAGVSRLVLTSSTATVGPAREQRRLSNESDPMSPAARESVYFAVKEVIERQVLAERELETIIACPAGIVGELDVKAGTGFFIIALAHGLLPFYVQGKTNIVDADDMAFGQVAMAEKGRPGERYILGGHNTTIRDLLDATCEELGIRFPAWRLPLRLARPLSTIDEMRCSVQGRGARPFIPREFVDIVTHGQWLDTTKASRELDLPLPKPLHVSIRKACAWYERFRYIPRRNASDGACAKRAVPRIFAATTTSNKRQGH